MSTGSIPGATEHPTKEQMDKAIDLQNKEFDAVQRLSERWTVLTKVAVVDDDYPEVRHKYESAVKDVIDAFRDNGRRVTLGATGQYPDGSKGPHDEGELQMGVAHDSEGTVHLNFGREVAWIGLDQAHAIQLAKMILHHAGIKRVELEM